MSKVNITELPSIQSVEHKPVSFRGNTSSNQYNTFHEDTYFDITNLYSVINDMTFSFQEMSMAHSVDSAYTQMRIGDMPSIIEQLQSEIDGYKNGTHRKVVIYPSKVRNGSEDKADINIQYGQVNIPAYAVSSKLYIYDESLDLITIPSTLISKVTPESDGIAIIDNDFENCVKNYENEYFIRKVYSDSTEPVELQVEITLPDNIISNRNVNTIYVSPYPFAALDILGIEYQAETDWKPIPGFTSHKQYEDGAIKNAENIKLCFNKMQISKIRFKLRQSKYIVEGDKNAFYLGIKHLGINYEAVDKKFCTFIADINFNSTKKKTIFNIVPKLNNNNILSDTTENKKTLFSFEVYSVNDIGEKRYIKDTIPFTFTDERLMVITNMYYDSTNDINPSLYKLEIEYDIEGDGSGGSQTTTPDDPVSSDNDCKCILSDMVFNGDSIIIGADENSKPYKLTAATILDGGCDIQNHIDKNIVYTYTIKSYGAGARISGDTLIVNSSGVVTITATARLGKAIVSKDAMFVVDKIKKYTLTYLSTTGGTLEGKKIQNIELGNDASPIKAIENIGYHFLSWSDDVLTQERHDTNVTSSAIYTAQFEINEYPVIYLNKEGKEFYREMVKHGFPAKPPTAPVLDDYLFTGWDKPLDCIIESVTVQAQYRIKTFIVKFLDWDDRVIDTQEIIIHKDAVVPKSPTKDGYDFVGWSDSTTAVTRDITSKAQFDIKTFVVTFLNWNGAELSKQTVNWMTDAKAPTTTKDGWHFIGWSGVYTKVTKDITVTALFEINVYQVKFVDWDGKVLSTVNVSHGSDATAPQSPTKTGYDFTGWDSKFASVTNHITVTAQFKIKVFTISASVSGDGTYSLSSASVEYGSPVTISFSAGITSDFKSITSNGKAVTSTSGKYTISQVTENINFSVLFEIKTFAVKWYNSGALIKSETVNYGTNVTSMHPATLKEGYDFTGWTTSSSSKDTSIISNTTYTAGFSIKTFRISPALSIPSDAPTGSVGTISPNLPQIVDWNTSKTFYFTTGTGFELYELQIDGKPMAFTSSSYTLSNIKEDRSIIGVYRWKTYTVTFKNWDGTVLKTETVKHGASATAPASPSRDGHTFNGWDRVTINITSNTTITATFKIIQYTVRFFNEGVVVKTQTVNWNTNATPPSLSKKWHALSGWSVGYTNVKSNIDTHAVWSAITAEPLKFYQLVEDTSTGVTKYKETADMTVYEYWRAGTNRVYCGLYTKWFKIKSGTNWINYSNCEVTVGDSRLLVGGSVEGSITRAIQTNDMFSTTLTIKYYNQTLTVNVDMSLILAGFAVTESASGKWYTSMSYPHFALARKDMVSRYDISTRYAFVNVVFSEDRSYGNEGVTQGWRNADVWELSQTLTSYDIDLDGYYAECDRNQWTSEPSANGDLGSLFDLSSDDVARVTIDWNSCISGTKRNHSTSVRVAGS